jgi:hypothetical protein
MMVRALLSDDMKLSSIKFILLPVVLSLLTSCGMFGDKQPEYYGVDEGASLEIPPHLDEPSSPTAFIIRRESVPMMAGEMDTSPPRIWSTSTDGQGNSQFSWSADGVFLLVEDSPESVQRRLKHVLERSGMILLDSGQASEYRFEYWQVSAEESFFGKMAFWRDQAYDYSGAYKTITRPDGENTRVYVKYADDTDCGPDAAEHVLEILRERLG